jgi:hypothetical protein
MIKNYNQFIKESFNGFRTIGEYIESLSKDNDYALNIISQYTQDIDPTVRIANVINLLPKSTQELILKLIKDEKTGREEPKEADIIAYTSANLNESVDSLAGKKIFQCFLKVITALGEKEISYNAEKTLKDFIFYFETNLLSVEDVKSVMGRYDFFDKFINNIDYTFNNCNLYYGIKLDGKFEYGIRTEDQSIVIGSFKLTNGVLKYFLTLSSPSVRGLKKQIATLDLSKLSLLGKIKQEMENFIPGSFEKKMKPNIIDNVISFGYFDQKIDLNEIENIKTNLKSFLIPFKWSDKVQINISVSGNHLFLNIKVK